VRGEQAGDWRGERYTRTGRSYYILMLTDEIWRRGQGMEKLPPGLPKQGGAMG